VPQRASAPEYSELWPAQNQTFELAGKS